MAGFKSCVVPVERRLGAVKDKHYVNEIRKETDKMPRSMIYGESRTARFAVAFVGVCVVYLLVGWAVFHTPLVRQLPGMLGAGIAVGLAYAFASRAPENKG